VSAAIRQIDCKANLLESCTNFFTEDKFERILFHANDMNGSQLAFGHSLDKFHGNERRTDYDKIFTLLCSYTKPMTEHFMAGILRCERGLTCINFLGILQSSERKYIFKVGAFNR
jgi:hypothetical protein